MLFILAKKEIEINKQRNEREISSILREMELEKMNKKNIDKAIYDICIHR